VIWSTMNLKQEVLILEYLKSHEALRLGLEPTKHAGRYEHITSDNERIKLENAQRVIDNPELVLKVIGKNLFSLDDVENTLKKYIEDEMQLTYCFQEAMKHLIKTDSPGMYTTPVNIQMLKRSFNRVRSRRIQVKSMQ
jgi:hypothetical protein